MHEMILRLPESRPIRRTHEFHIKPSVKEVDMNSYLKGEIHSESALSRLTTISNGLKGSRLLIVESSAVLKN
jgi:hypothetical protein